MDSVVVTNENVEEIFKNALQDPSLLSAIDIDQLLNMMDNPKTDYLENRTMPELANDVSDALTQLLNDDLKILEYKIKLGGYRLVDELHELHKGKHVRWIRRENGKLTNGGIICDMKEINDDIHLRCKNNMNMIFQIKLSEVIVFQKLTNQEKIILKAMKYLE